MKKRNNLRGQPLWTAVVSSFSQYREYIVPAVLFVCTIPVAIHWGKEWLFPSWINQNRLALALGVWLLLLLGSLLATRRYAAAVFLWLAFLAQWLALFRPESWAFGVGLGLMIGWLLCGGLSSSWRLIIAFVLTTVAVLLAGYERKYGSINQDTVAAVLQTHSAEASEFVFEHLSTAIFAMFVLMVVTQTAILRFYVRAPIRSPHKNIVLPFVVMLGLLGSSGQAERIKAVRDSLKLIEADEGEIVTPDPVSVERSLNAPLDVVFVIGESNSRWHWQLYGYPGETNPQLSRLRDELIVYSDVVSADSSTVPALREMMYRGYFPNDRPREVQSEKKISLIEILNSAAVETFWFSAQSAHGPWASPITRLANKSTVAQFFYKGQEGRASVQELWGNSDLLAKQAVLNTLSEPASNKQRFIVQHMLATHGPYCKHGINDDTYYPPVSGQAFFGTAKDLTMAMACYQRAIRFVDAVLAEIINKANARTKPTIVIFVPDHGEAPEEGTGHNNGVHSARHVEIPMVVHFNAAARRAFPQKHTRLKQNINHPFLNSWLNELVLDLFGITVKGMKVQAPSLASNAGSWGPRVLFRRTAPVYYDQLTLDDHKDVLELTRLNLAEVRRTGAWTAPLYAHRVDTQAKAIEAKQYFSGIEMDLMFDEANGQFNVYHPPAANHGLKLTDQLAAVADKPMLQFWFDLKNPALEKTPLILSALEALDKQWKLKQRTILELPESTGSQTMRAYSEAGWRISYYVPYSFGQCLPRNASKQTCVQIAEQVVDQATKGGATYLSFDYALFPAISDYLLSKNGTFRLLSWTDVDSAAPGLSERFASYPRFDGLIIPFKSKFNY